MAKPITWTNEKKKKAIELIFNRIANSESVRTILDKADRNIYPSWVTFNEWLSEDNELAKQYARTCELRAEMIFDEMITIADDQEEDIIIGEGGKEYVNHNVINRARLRVDTRKWILSKMNPKKYADKIDITTDNQKITGTTGLEKLTFEQLLELENAKRKK